MRTSLLLPALALGSTASSIPYSEYILAPKSRTLIPSSVHNSNGSITSPEHLTSSAPRNSTTTFLDSAAAAYDFGINIAGVVSVDVAAVSDANQYIGITFSESSLWVSNASSDATADAGKDETLWFHVPRAGRYTAPREKERGGFRYMTVVHNGTGRVELSAVQVQYTSMPHWADDAIGNYTGFFHCEGEYFLLLREGQQC
jgi:hypothetical protein